MHTQTSPRPNTDTYIFTITDIYLSSRPPHTHISQNKKQKNREKSNGKTPPGQAGQPSAREGRLLCPSGTRAFVGCGRRPSSSSSLYKTKRRNKLKKGGRKRGVGERKGPGDNRGVCVDKKMLSLTTVSEETRRRRRKSGGRAGRRRIGSRRVRRIGRSSRRDRSSSSSSRGGRR